VLKETLPSERGRDEYCVASLVFRKLADDYTVAYRVRVDVETLSLFVQYPALSEDVGRATIADSDSAQTRGGYIVRPESETGHAMVNMALM
jgi:hypothetical protein